MKSIAFLSVLAISLIAIGGVDAAELHAIDSHLEPFRPLLEKTWKGPFTGTKPDKPVVDVMRRERALNGKAVRALHSINDGAYGGETIFMWDAKKQEVQYHYFSTAGFMTVGSVKFEDGKWITHEVVTGSSARRKCAGRASYCRAANFM